MGCSVSHSEIPKVTLHRSKSFYRTVEDIPNIAFQQNWVLQCQVVQIPDGDTIRCRHIPGFKYQIGQNAFPGEASGKDRPSWRAKLRKETLVLRLCGIDAPETAKFGAPGQPFAEEAAEYLRNRCLETVVLIKLLGKDQYGRALAVVIVEERESKCCCVNIKIRKDVGEELVLQGLATVYYGIGAEYDGRKERYEKLMEEAKSNKRGLWNMGSQAIELPGQYRKRMKRRYKKQRQKEMEHEEITSTTRDEETEEIDPWDEKETSYEMGFAYNEKDNTGRSSMPPDASNQGPNRGRRDTGDARNTAAQVMPKTSELIDEGWCQNWSDEEPELNYDQFENIQPTKRKRKNRKKKRKT